MKLPMSRLPSRLLAGWRTGLPRTVRLLQAGNAVNSFGYGLVLPFEIIYLHQARGFGTATAGLVLATVMGTAAVSAAPVGALLDRFRAKPVLIGGSVVSALGYGGFALVDRPWQAFLCSAAAGLGLGASGAANPTLIMTLVTREQRPSAIALSRVAVNLGLGGGATVAGFVVASAQHVSSFQALYVFDAMTFLIYALVVLVAVPNRRVARETGSVPAPASFRTVARDRTFVVLIAANVVLTIVGYSLFANILPPFAKAHTPVGSSAIGALFFVNTAFIVIAQLPATRVVQRVRRTHAFAGIGALWAVACLGVLPTTALGSETAATFVLVGVAIAFAIGECAHFVVLGPLVVDLAPPHLLGRYMSLYGLTFTAGLALGPALGGALLAVSPDAVWWVGALLAAGVGFGLLRFSDRIPDPLAASEPDDCLCAAPAEI